MRRAQALDATALLIDEHSRIAPHRIAKRRSQAAHLRRGLNIPLEDNKAPGRALTQKRPLCGRQYRARKSGDESAYRHGRG
jgi:hypothetical protein